VDETGFPLPPERDLLGLGTLFTTTLGFPATIFQNLDGSGTIELGLTSNGQDGSMVILGNGANLDSTFDVGARGKYRNHSFSPSEGSGCCPPSISVWASRHLAGRASLPI
jgi:hypothetical protein